MLLFGEVAIFFLGSCCSFFLFDRFLKKPVIIEDFLLRRASIFVIEIVFSFSSLFVDEAMFALAGPETLTIPSLLVYPVKKLAEFNTILIEDLEVYQK